MGKFIPYRKFAQCVDPLDKNFNQFIGFRMLVFVFLVCIPFRCGGFGGPLFVAATNETKEIDE